MIEWTKMYHPCASKISDTDDIKEVITIIAMANKWDLTTNEYCTINSLTANILSPYYLPATQHTQRNQTAQSPKGQDSSHYIKNRIDLKR